MLLSSLALTAARTAARRTAVTFAASASSSSRLHFLPSASPSASSALSFPVPSTFSTSTSTRDSRSRLSAVESPLDHVSSRSFAAGRRTYRLDLRREANTDRHFLKLTEFSGRNQSSLLLSAADASAFLVEFAGLDRTQKQVDASSSERYQLGQGELAFATLRCSHKEGKFFEMSLSENRHGKFYRIKEKASGGENVRGGTVMMEHAGRDDLLDCFKKVMEENGDVFESVTAADVGNKGEEDKKGEGSPPGQLA